MYSRAITRRAFAAGSIASAIALAGTQSLMAQDATPVVDATPAAGPVPEVLLTGLADPRFLAIDGNDILFTEAGSGGDEQVFTIPGDGTPEPTAPVSSTGTTGKLSRLSADGTVTEIVSDFRSYTFGAQGEIVGPAGVVRDDMGNAYVAVGAPGPFISEINLTGEEGVVFRVNLETGEKEEVASLIDWELSQNPDPVAVDSNIYGLDLLDGVLYVADAGGNSIIAVDAETGDTSTFAVTGGLDAPFFPDSGNPSRGGTKEIDSVPSSVVVGPDKRLYVSFITGGPFPTGFSPVYVFDLDGSQETYTEGLTMVQDLAFASNGSLYASLMSTDFLSMAPGQIVRINANGSQTIVIDNLILPAGIAFDANDNLYVVNKCTGIPGGGELLRYSGIVADSSAATPEPDETEEPDETPEATGVASGSSEPLRILMQDTYFEPSTLQISGNVDIRLVLDNRGFLLHNFVLDEPRINSDTLGNGQSTQLIMNLPPGEYVFYCSQVGHRAQGMEGTITVV